MRHSYHIEQSNTLTADIISDSVGDDAFFSQDTVHSFLYQPQYFTGALARVPLGSLIRQCA